MTEVENYRPQLYNITRQPPTTVAGGGLSVSRDGAALRGACQCDGNAEKRKRLAIVLASLEDQAEAAAGREPRDSGWGILSAAPPLSACFPIQAGDTATLDWPDSPFPRE